MCHKRIEFIAFRMVSRNSLAPGTSVRHLIHNAGLYTRPLHCRENKEARGADCSAKNDTYDYNGTQQASKRLRGANLQEYSRLVAHQQLVSRQVNCVTGLVGGGASLARGHYDVDPLIESGLDGFDGGGEDLALAAEESACKYRSGEKGARCCGNI